MLVIKDVLIVVLLRDVLHIDDHVDLFLLSLCLVLSQEFLVLLFLDNGVVVSVHVRGVDIEHLTDHDGAATIYLVK